MSALTILISTAKDYPEIQTIGKWLLGMGAATSLVSLVDYYERFKEKATKRL